VKAVVDEEDAKAILLNNSLFKYDNVIFTPSKLPSRTLEDMIASLFLEEKRTIAGDIEDDTQIGMALYSRNNCSRSTKDKGEIECYHCKKMGHTAWNCRFRANDSLKGKVKDRLHVANATNVVDQSDADNGDDFTEEREFYV
jgi:hypothetical protein